MKKIVGIMMGLGLACAANAEVIYQMSDSNVSLVSNNSITMSATGDTSTGTMAVSVASPGVDKSWVEAVSTGNIQALNGGTAITAADTVTISYTVDSSDDLENLGFEIGLADSSAALRTSADSMTTRLRAYGNRSNPAETLDGWAATDPVTTYITVDEASLVDGHSVEMTFSASGWTLSVADIEENANASVTTIVDSGTWTGTEFVDNINGAHFYVAAQMNGTGTFEYVLSEASLSVIPEPATLGLITAFGGGLLFVRRLIQM